MKAIKLIILFVAINFNTFYSQTVDINFLVTDGFWPLLSVRVGLDTTATNGLDPHLGEYRLSLFEGFGAVFDISQYTGTTTWILKDYRYAPSFPFTGIIEHRLGWQLSIPWGIAFTIYYNFPPTVTANIKDEFGGMFFNENLSDSGSFTVPNDLINWAILTMYYDNVIPVELVSFNAILIDNRVELDWTTATETNNSGFEIERREMLEARSEEWKVITFVNGQGTTTEPQSYFYKDENLSSGNYQYRLKQIDFDGTFEYSNIVEAEILPPAKFSLEQNYPNPFNPSTSIQYAIPSRQFVSLKIFNSLGEEITTLVNEEKPVGNHTIEFKLESSIKNLVSGVYLYQLKVGEFVQTKKMILMK